MANERERERHSVFGSSPQYVEPLRCCNKLAGYGSGYGSLLVQPKTFRNALASGASNLHIILRSTTTPDLITQDWKHDAPGVPRQNDGKRMRFNWPQRASRQVFLSLVRHPVKQRALQTARTVQIP